MRDFVGRSALGLSGVVLGIALSAWPLVSVAQPAPTPQAMVELSSSDITSWGFAAVVPVGGTITWSNMGSQAHTVTATDGSFDSGLVDPGGSVTLHFDTGGTFAYMCTPHPWMKGFVTVVPFAASSSSMAMVEGDASDINSWGFAANVAAGQSIEWTNTGQQAHTVTSTSGAFDTGMVSPGSTAPLVFDTPGLYPYLCVPHPWMKGVVVVS
jgi:plastocyanin